MLTLGGVPRPSLQTRVRLHSGDFVQTGWRGLVPVVVGGVVALGIAVPLTAGASTAPPARTAKQLLADLSAVDLAGYSGTVVQKSTLLTRGGSTSTGLSLSRLMSGTNTIKVWYGGPARSRIAVLDATGENDLFRDGAQVWQWDSGTKRAVTQTVSIAKDAIQAVPIPVDGTTVTPDDLARQAVAAIDPSTSVRVGASSTVAGRPAYQLLLTPATSSKSLIGEVVLSLDGATRMPLAAQVFARGSTGTPQIDLAFTRIAFDVPDDATFQFQPPRGAKISTYSSSSGGDISSPDPLLGLLSTQTVGSSWTRVAVVKPPNNSADYREAITGQFGTRLTEVSGTWGRGKLLRTAVLSMLFVSTTPQGRDDGRIVIGAVAPDALYAAIS